MNNMSLKNDIWITDKALNESMIHPFSIEQVKQEGDRPVVSYGVTSFGYDIRMGNELKLFKIHPNNKYHNTTTNKTGEYGIATYENDNIILDPKDFKDVSKNLEPVVDPVTNDKYFLMPPYSFALGTSLEYVEMPNNVYSLLTTKSSYARCGILLNCTGLQPSFRGNITIEFTNPTPYSVKLYIGEGLANLVFFEGEVPHEVYKGKYQGQIGTTFVR